MRNGFAVALIALSGCAHSETHQMIPPKFPLVPAHNEVGRERRGCEKITLERTPEQIKRGVPADVMTICD